jgi:hypothetical protein
VRGFSLTDSGVTAETDWLLEQAGFELPVPLATVSPVKRRNVAGGPFSAAMMTETEKLRTERLVAQPWQIEGLPLGRIR